ncbi:MAG TPA: ATP-binding protein [Candidatus Acidoferrales bacterium]|nr:ATP-binding protein [Candidatus Acidoferrales bacterium]
MKARKQRTRRRPGVTKIVAERRRMKDELKRYAEHLEELVEERTRKLAESENELRASRERLEHVISQNPAVVFLAKPLPDLSDYYMTYLSRSVASSAGFKSKELTGEKGNELWASRVHPDDLASNKSEVAKLWKKGHHVFLYRFRDENGMYRWIREEANVIRDGHGKPFEIVGCSTDVTESKEMEQRLAVSERLAAIGQTAAMVAHDLRNPLQATSTSLYLMKKLVDSEEIDKAKEELELLNELETQVNYMNKIISDLQDYSKPVSVERVETDLANLVKQVTSNANFPKNIETLVVTHGEIAKVLVDPTLLKRVLLNLVSNGIQAMPNGGRVTIVATHDRDYVTISVEDSGVGIPEENLGKLFNPFFTTKTRGQGLGLAVCKRLVEAQKGTITVKSELGRGSTFMIKIPISSKVEAS